MKEKIERRTIAKSDARDWPLEISQMQYYSQQSCNELGDSIRKLADLGHLPNSTLQNMSFKKIVSCTPTPPGNFPDMMNKLLVIHSIFHAKGCGTPWEKKANNEISPKL